MATAARAYTSLPADERQEFRLSKLLKDHLIQAAALKGESTAQYVIEAVAERVSRDLAEATAWDLTVPEQKRVLELLSNPPAPTTAMVKALRKANELFGPAETKK